MKKLTCCSHPPGICQGLTLSLLGLRHERSSLLSYKLEHWSVFELKAKRWTSAAHLPQQKKYSLAQPQGKRFDKRGSNISAKGHFFIFQVTKKLNRSTKALIWCVKEEIVNFPFFFFFFFYNLHILAVRHSIRMETLLQH